MSLEFIILIALTFLFSILVLTIGERKRENIVMLDFKVFKIIRNLISVSENQKIRKDIIYTSCKKLLETEAQEAYESVERLKKANYVKEPQVWYPGYAMVSTGYIVLTV